MTREMKNSGVEWIGNIPSEWRIGRVKNAFTRKTKKHIKKSLLFFHLQEAVLKLEIYQQEKVRLRKVIIITTL